MLQDMIFLLNMILVVLGMILVAVVALLVTTLAARSRRELDEPDHIPYARRARTPPPLPSAERRAT